MILSLTGFMGCGKSSVGKRISELLCCPFIDLDNAIEESEGRCVQEIFASDGEAEFRAIERDTLSTILSATPPCHPDSVPCHPERSGGSPSLVLSLGGGTIMTPENEKRIHEETFCVYLKASIETLAEHLEAEVNKRPLLAEGSLRTRIEKLMDARSDTYERTAHLIINTDGKSVETIASDIINSPLMQ